MFRKFIISLTSTANAFERLSVSGPIKKYETFACFAQNHFQSRKNSSLIEKTPENNNKSVSPSTPKTFEEETFGKHQNLNVLGHSVINENSLTSLVVDNKTYADLPIAYVTATKNNTKVVVINPGTGKHISFATCGTEGYVNAKKCTTVAQHSLGLSVGLRSRRSGVTHVRAVIRGIGTGKLPALKGIVQSGIQIVSLTEDTPIHLGLGRRPRKPPRK